MAKIKAKDTKPELLLRRALWHRGLRYRAHNKNLPGNPDICIKKYRLVIFIDGEFWHGYKWGKKKLRIKANRDYWIKKIEGNIRRDKKINRYYVDSGWIIVRFWEHEVNSSLNTCIEDILKRIETIKNII